MVELFFLALTTLQDTGHPSLRFSLQLQSLETQGPGAT